MSKLVSKFGLVTAIAIGALVAALAAAPSQAAPKRAAHSRAYDGLWSVSVYTSYGPCATYRYPARIVAGRVVQAVNDFSYQISGAVAEAAPPPSPSPVAAKCGRLWPAARRERSGTLERGVISAPAPGAPSAARRRRISHGFPYFRRSSPSAHSRESGNCTKRPGPRLRGDERGNATRSSLFGHWRSTTDRRQPRAGNCRP